MTHGELVRRLRNQNSSPLLNTLEAEGHSVYLRRAGPSLARSRSLVRVSGAVNERVELTVWRHRG